jgi:colanic acid biosynthesis protein WcaH
MTYLDDPSFRTVIRSTPLVAVDLILTDRGRILLGQRSNRPAKGSWFVPGGRIRKDETIDASIERIAAAETQLHITAADVSLLGVYEHHDADNVFGEPGYGTHYVVLAYRAVLRPDADVQPDQQHGELRWWHFDEARTSPLVHANTRAYLSSTVMDS